MTRITLDTAACDQLGAVNGSAEICDKEGQTVGYFVSGNRKPGQPPADFAIPISREEIERRRKTKTGRTTEEILRGLGL